MDGVFNPMDCTRPLQGWRSQGGRVVTQRSQGYRDRPVTVSCGMCMGCRIARSRDWALRCMHEAQMHSTNCFITLTYDDEHLPKDGSLKVAHWQKFARKVRKRIGPFRFLHSGEYGDINGRPHYHACIFGIDFNRGEWSRFKERKQKWTGETHTLYTSKLLDSLWNMGHASVGDLTYGSAGYVARYVMKKQMGKSASVYGDKKPPYCTMSRRPGIGYEWFQKYHGDIFPRDEMVYDGKKFPTPRYYTNLYEEMDEESAKSIKAKRIVANKRKNITADNRYAKEAEQAFWLKTKIRGDHED